MKKVSIIIPCYNVESTIDRCMEGLLSQTIGVENLEIIMINDASTDHSLEKMAEYEQKYNDSMIVITYEENGKLGKARNIGMQYATGKYLAFVDDDDVIEPDMYRFLYQTAEEEQCDLVVCRSVREEAFHPLKNPQNNSDERKLMTFETEQKRLEFLQTNINTAVWNKLYRRDLLMDNQITFPENRIYEDFYFTGLVKHYCQKACITNRIFYHHIATPDSISHFSNISPTEFTALLEIQMMLIEALRDGMKKATFRCATSLLWQATKRCLAQCQMKYSPLSEKTSRNCFPTGIISRIRSNVPGLQTIC